MINVEKGTLIAFAVSCCVVPFSLIRSFTLFQKSLVFMPVRPEQHSVVDSVQNIMRKVNVY